MNRGSCVPRAVSIITLRIASVFLVGGFVCAAQAAPMDAAAQYRAVGLRYPNGKPHLTPPPHAVSGKTLDVRDFGADPANSGADDSPAIEAAFNAARVGDEIYFPNGTYNLLSPSTRDKYTNIVLRSGINLRGESTAGVLLISSFDVGAGMTPLTVIRGQDVQDILVSNITVSSTWKRKFPTDHRVQNPDRGGPLYAVATESSSGSNQRITFDSVNVERFARMGFRIGMGSSDVAIRRSVASKATDTGGGGAGYGFVLQGAPHLSSDNNPYLNTNKDNYFNVIEACTAQGPYIRHGALIQFWAHNNVVRNSHFDQVVLDAIDLHGEDEYLNEISGNTIVGTSAGAGIGLGNSGAIHDKSGPWNWIHHNTISNSMRGITVEYGTRFSLVEENVIQGNDQHAHQFGIGLGSVSDVVIRRNQIINNRAPAFAAIKLYGNRAQGEEPAGAPKNSLIEGNTIRGNTGDGARALLVVEQSGGNVFQNNFVSSNTDNSFPQQ